jgi:hypothetical protein
LSWLVQLQVEIASFIALNLYFNFFFLLFFLLLLPNLVNICWGRAAEASRSNFVKHVADIQQYPIKWRNMKSTQEANTTINQAQENKRETRSYVEILTGKNYGSMTQITKSKSLTNTKKLTIY